MIGGEEDPELFVHDGPGEAGTIELRSWGLSDHLGALTAFFVLHRAWGLMGQVTQSGPYVAFCLRLAWLVVQRPTWTIPW